MSNKKIIIIDYQSGNLFSISQALSNIGLNVAISSDPNDISEADAIVLPGVGAFGSAMENLEQMQAIGPIKEFVSLGKPFLGICLGLQLLFTNSEEFGSSKGLNLVSGTVKRFQNTKEAGGNLKVPQIAWNTIEKTALSWDGTPLYNIKDQSDMYFVHSYFVTPEEKQIILAETVYGDTRYTSSILSRNIFACQFHPEKSGREGLKIYKNWAILNNLI